MQLIKFSSLKLYEKALFIVMILNIILAYESSLKATEI